VEEKPFTLLGWFFQWRLVSKDPPFDVVDALTETLGACCPSWAPFGLPDLDTRVYLVEGRGGSEGAVPPLSLELLPLLHGRRWFQRLLVAWRLVRLVRGCFLCRHARR
jgi:hypothetical protein